MTLKELKSKHDQLKKLDGGGFFRSPSYNVFGSGTHKYKINPRLSESDVSEFERIQSIKLPVDYRNFLVEIGNGGSGPCYGLFPLSDWNYELIIIDKNFLSTGFPHAGAWNVSKDLNVNDEDYYDSEEYQRWEKAYFSNEHVTGSIRICHYGCAIYYLLVVSGGETGNIWVDDRANDNGIYPALHEATKKRLSFMDWYDEWLTESINLF